MTHGSGYGLAWYPVVAFAGQAHQHLTHRILRRLLATGIGNDRAIQRRHHLGGWRDRCARRGKTAKRYP